MQKKFTYLDENSPSDMNFNITVTDVEFDKIDELQAAWCKFLAFIDSMIEDGKNKKKTFGDWILFSSHIEAEKLVEDINEAIKERGALTVAEFYDICELDHKLEDYKRGWIDPIPVKIRKRDNRGFRNSYYLILPDPVVIKYKGGN